jgi:uncharacterized membrane protein (DUF485 family)
MKNCLLIALLLPVCAYYLIIAFAPGVLALQVGGVPLSILLALGLIWLGFAITLLYVWSSKRKDGAHA